MALKGSFNFYLTFKVIYNQLISELNIATRKKDEENIRFKAELLNTIGQAVIATNMDGIINFWNKAAEEIYGWPLQKQ